MKELRLSQEFSILMPTEDVLLHTAIMNAKLDEKGFDLNKKIDKYLDKDTGDIVYTQE